MNKNIINYVAIAIFAVIPLTAFGQTATPSPVGATASTQNSTAGATASSNGSVAGASASSGLSVSGATASSANSTAGATASSGQSTSGATSGAGLTVSNGASSATPAPVPPANNGGGSSGSTGSSSSSSGSASTGGGYGGFSSGGRSRSASCMLITKFMSPGATNDSAEVIKLQFFFKNTLGYNVDINGIFDAKTVTAVKAFQNKYAETIMAPWGITEATGNVYITTLKQINKLACNQPLTLDPSELAIINSYRNGNGSTNANQAESEVTIKPVKIVVDSDVNASTSSSEDNSGNDVENQSENVATVAKASILGRFWNFIVSLFK